MDGEQQARRRSRRSSRNVNLWYVEVADKFEHAACCGMRNAAAHRPVPAHRCRRQCCIFGILAGSGACTDGDRRNTPPVCGISVVRSRRRQQYCLDSDERMGLAVSILRALGSANFQESQLQHHRVILTTHAHDLDNGDGAEHGIGLLVQSEVDKSSCLLAWWCEMIIVWFFFLGNPG